jgi:hypothetical protein
MSETFDHEWMEKEFAQVRERIKGWSDGMRGRYHCSSYRPVTDKTGVSKDR